MDHKSNLRVSCYRRRQIKLPFLSLKPLYLANDYTISEIGHNFKIWKNDTKTLDKEKIKNLYDMVWTITKGNYFIFSNQFSS